MELELAVDVVQAQEAQEAQARTAQVLVVLADWESAKGRQEAAGEALEAHFAVQEVQEGLESVRMLLGSVREALLAQAGAEPVQEVPEVQDHPSRLPPDLAALAHPEHPQASPRQCLWARGCPPGRAEGQRR